MNDKEWQTGKPPHNVVVEVEYYEYGPVQARAVWGDKDKGVLPHWELATGVHVEANAITRWRYI